MSKPLLAAGVILLVLGLGFAFWPRETNMPVTEAEPSEALKTRIEGEMATPETASSQRLVAEVPDIKKLRQKSSGSLSLASPLIKALQGEFSGQLAPSAYNQETWTVDTNMQFREEADKLVGDYTMEISSEIRGRFSRIRGDFSAPPQPIALLNDEGGVLLEISPTEFMHLLYAKETDSFFGNFYGLNEQGQTLYHGPITLTRR